MIHCGDISINPATKCIFCGDVKVEMGGTRVPKILYMLAEQPNRYIPHRDLYDAIFPATQYDARHLMIDVVNRIRKLLAQIGSKLVLKNVKNEGYMLEWAETDIAHSRCFTERQMQAFRRVLDIANPIAPDLVAMLRDSEEDVI